MRPRATMSPRIVVSPPPPTSSLVSHLYGPMSPFLSGDKSSRLKSYRCLMIAMVEVGLKS